ncbi:oligosaccharide flippase family protein [Candidatus Uhrbacteria bacterium]|nr:oligosaccharide flippase family protein [Candidatus Uhrbacteria bacterium]
MGLRQLAGRVATRLTALLRLDVRFYGRSFTLMSFGHASAVLRGVATTFLMARWLPRETLGEFRYILAVFGIAGIFSMTGLNASVIRGVARGDIGVVRIALKRIALVSPLGSVLLGLAALERHLHGETTVAFGILIAAAAFPLYSLCGMYGPILTGKEHVRRLVQLAVVNNLLFAALFFAVILNVRGLLAITVAYFGFDILIRGAYTLRELRRIPSDAPVGDHLRLGSHLSAINAFQTVAGQLDQILLQRFFGYGTLANYSVAMLIPEQIKDFVNGISGIVLRRFSRREETGAVVTATRRHFKTMFALSGVMVLVYAALAPFALPWLFPQYAAEILPSIVYATGLVAMASIVGVNFFQAHDRLRDLWRFYVANTALQIGTNLLLIPALGAWGAVLSKTITRVASIPLSYPRSVAPSVRSERTRTTHRL